MKKDVKISICIPTFNRADLIATTLECVARQTEKPDEVIVIDNASTDNTKEIVQKFNKYGIQYIRNKTNVGMAANYDRCIELASNDYFTFLPSDDLIAPTWVASWKEIMSNVKADLYTSPMAVVDNTYNVEWTYPLFPTDTFVKKESVLHTFADVFTPGLAPNAATVYRRDVFKEMGGFDLDAGTECDLRPSMRLFKKCDVYYHNKILFAFRAHEVRSFDSKVEERGSKFYQRLEHHFEIVKDMYQTLYKNNPDKRCFLHVHLFMNICNINLYLARGELRKVIESNRMMMRYFPNLFRKFEDYPAFFRYQIEFLKRGLRHRKISPSHMKELAWLEDLKKITP